MRSAEGVINSTNGKMPDEAATGGERGKFFASISRPGTRMPLRAYYRRSGNPAQPGLKIKRFMPFAPVCSTARTAELFVAIRRPAANQP
jgi:hypothetical protein